MVSVIALLGCFWIIPGIFVLCRESAEEVPIRHKMPFNNDLQNTGYGTEWILFPDGDGMPHFVNMTESYLPNLRYEIDRDIELRLYSRKNNDQYIILDQSAKPITNSNISEIISNKPIKIVTHGWMSSADKSVVIRIKDSYLKSKDVIVIGVDWSNIAMNPFYPKVAQETWDVGSSLGQFLNAFSELYKVPGDRIHLIGHSLGAHVMGIAGFNSNITIDRITGLDPARPFFEIPKSTETLSLDTSDADFVDVIHTCSGMLGVEIPTGHADFYPNGGMPPQPGCESVFFILEACSHSRSHIYFAESIEYPEAFPTCKTSTWSNYTKNKCEQTTFMGDNVEKNVTGTFYLQTNPSYPYGRYTL